MGWGGKIINIPQYHVVHFNIPVNHSLHNRQNLWLNWIALYFTVVADEVASRCITFTNSNYTCALLPTPVNIKIQLYWLTVTLYISVLSPQQRRYPQHHHFQVAVS